MKNHRVRVFGDPISSSGAKYFLRNQEDLITMKVDLDLAMLRINGIHPNHQSLKQVESKVRHEQIVESKRISQQGIPESIEKLIEVSKKADVVKFCKQLAISQWDLFLLIHNCNQLKFRHRSRFPKFVPPHLEINDNDRADMQNGVLTALSKKIFSLMRERRNICVHLFEGSAEWHCFYFSYRDIDTEGNHWSQGAHLHYINHLWPNITKEQVWRAFDTRFTKLPGDLHIKFEPFNYSLTTGPKEPDSPEVLAGIATVGFAVLDARWSPS